MIREGWMSLTDRDRRIVLIGAVIAALLFFYVALLSPFFSSLAAARASVAHRTRLVQWMQNANQRIQSLRESGVVAGDIGNESLLAFVDHSLHENQLDTFVTHVKQTEDNHVAVSFNAVPFDTLIRWLTMVWKKYTLEVSGITIKSTDKIGMVQAEVVL